MKMNDYILDTEHVFFKHEISRDMTCDAYSMHTHNMYELIYFLNGDATHVIEDRKYKLKKGDLVLIRPFCYHFIQIDSRTDYERYNILFDIERHAVESARLIPDNVEVVNISENAIAKDIFRRCDLYAKACVPELFSMLMSHLLSELFYNLSIFPQESSTEGASASLILSKALRYINENLCTLSGIEEIADQLFVSKSYLFRLFRSELRQTPRKYILDKRLLLAESMLNAGERPTVACEKCGFGDYTTFYRNYVSFFGRTPSEKTKPHETLVVRNSPPFFAQ